MLYKKIIMILLIISLIVDIPTFIQSYYSTIGSGIKENNHEVEKVTDEVYDLGTYSSLNVENAERLVAKKADGWTNKGASTSIEIGGCTAIHKNIQDGNSVVGRNMDFFQSQSPVLLGEVDVPDKYRVKFISQLDMLQQSSAEMENCGINQDAYDMAPFLAADTMNEKGLYVELNMRMDYQDDEGNYVFGCDGHNDEKGERVSSLCSALVFAQNCATVKEAVEYANTINFYTPLTALFSWSGAVMISDASGDCAVIELGKNKVSVLQGQEIQTNFFLTEEYAKDSLYQVGLGRYAYASKCYNDIQTESDMQDVLTDLYYTNLYNWPQSWDKIDWTSEYAGQLPFLDTEFLSRTDAQKSIAPMLYIIKLYSYVFPRAGMQLLSLTWETVYSCVANCTDKTMTLRFHQNNDFEKVITF